MSAFLQGAVFGNNRGSRRLLARTRPSNANGEASTCVPSLPGTAGGADRRGVYGSRRFPVGSKRGGASQIREPRERVRPAITTRGSLTQFGVRRHVQPVCGHPATKAGLAVGAARYSAMVGPIRPAPRALRPDRTAAVCSHKSASMFSSHRMIFISVSIGASDGSNRMAFISVSIGPSAGSSAHACVERAIAATVASKMRLDIAPLPLERTSCSSNV